MPYTFPRRCTRTFGDKIRIKAVVHIPNLIPILAEKTPFAVGMNGGKSMDDIISKILQMDETARKMNDEAQAEKIASREEVKKKRQQVYDEYLESAKAHVEEFKKSAAKSSEEEWQAALKHYDSVSLLLEKKFEDNKEKWVNDIVDSVLKR